METISCTSSPGKNRISVALCTYKGEKFLPRQLESIENQTRLPDEVIICDDRSSDGTVGILKEFAASAPFPVKIIVNQENLGSTRNFEQAIRACTGDLIALSDQDDLWYPIRLERSEQELLAHPKVGLVFSDADIVDSQDQTLRTTMWAAAEFTDRVKRRLLAGDYQVCVSHRFVTGATVMFRKSLRDRCLPIGPGWVHDTWIAATAAAFTDLRPIDEPLIRYRKHAFQQLGPNLYESLRERARKSWWKHWSALSTAEGAEKQRDFLSGEMRKMEALCNALSDLPLDEEGRARLSSYRDYLQSLSFRSNLPRHRLVRLYPILSNRFRYSQHFSGLKSMVKDLLLSR